MVERASTVERAHGGGVRWNFLQERGGGGGQPLTQEQFVLQITKSKKGVGTPGPPPPPGSAPAQWKGPAWWKTTHTVERAHMVERGKGGAQLRVRRRRVGTTIR